MAEVPHERLKDWALGYVRSGWHVIPLRPSEKAPTLVKHWKEEASNSEEQVLEWWAKEPRANIGIVLPRGVVVLDCDTPQAAKRAEAWGMPWNTPRVKTSRGYHYYFALPSDFTATNGRIEVDGVQMDVKTFGGYVVAPPSVHPSGAVYRWDRGHLGKPDRIPFQDYLPVAPNWLLDAIKRKTEPRQSLAEITEDTERPPKTYTDAQADTESGGDASSVLPQEAFAALQQHWTEGQRHQNALALAGYLAKNGVPESEALRIVTELAQNAGDTELADRLRAVSDTYKRKEQLGEDAILGASGLPEAARAPLPRNSKHKREQKRDSMQPIATENAHPRTIAESEVREAFRRAGERLAETLGAKGVLAHLLVSKRSITVSYRELYNLLLKSPIVDDIRFVRGVEFWRYWDGRKWVKVDAVDMVGHVAVFFEGVFSSLPKRASKALLKQLNTLSKVRDALDMLQDVCATELSDWDAVPGVIGTPDGVLNLRTLTYEPNPKRLLITKQTRGRYIPGLRSEVLERFLHTITGGNKELQDYLLQIFGAALEGRNWAHRFYVLFGTGANGKTTLASAIMHTLGDYAAPMPRDAVTSEKYARDKISMILPSLAGVRVAVLEELPPGAELSATAIKDLTSNEPQKAREIYSKYFDLSLYLTPFVISNTTPRIREHTEGIWRRLRLVPFRVFIHEKDRDPELPEKLRGECDAIFTALVEACQKARAANWRIPEPEEVRKATEGYRSGEDVLVEFLNTCTESAPHGWVTVKELYDAYLQFCNIAESEAEKAAKEGDILGRRAFTDALKDKGFVLSRRRGKNGFRGLRIVQTEGTENATSEGATQAIEMPF